MWDEGEYNMQDKEKRTRKGRDEKGRGKKSGGYANHEA